MNNNAVHQSLIEIQDNLKKLESARSQVVTVTANSEKLIQTLVDLVADVEKLRNLYKEASKTASQDIKEGVKVFSKAMEQNLGLVQEEVSSVSNKSAESVDQLITRINTIDKRMAAAVDSTVSSFDRKLNEGSKLLLDQSKSVWNNYDNHVSNLLRHFEQLKGSIDALKIRVEQTDFNAAFQTFQKQIEDLKSANERLIAASAIQHQEVTRTLKAQFKQQEKRSWLHIGFTVLLFLLTLLVLVGFKWWKLSR